MGKEDTEDERDEFPEGGIKILDREGLAEAHKKFERRKTDDPKSKYKQRKSDNERGGREDRGGSTAIVFGKKKSA